jgi:aryl-alcohol dehydrogenase-like predicted oxidoreductase
VVKELTEIVAAAAGDTSYAERTSLPRATAERAPRSRRAALERCDAARHDAGAVAVTWTLVNPAVVDAIVDVPRPTQIDPKVAGAGLELDDAELLEIERAN